MRKATQEEFVAKSVKAHGDTYGYNNAVYINNDTEVMITCKIHGDFPQRPVVHYTGSKSGCPTCAITRGATKRSAGKDKFIKKSIKKHGEIYGFKKAIYKNSSTELTLTCLRCNEDFPVTPNNHLGQESGCPSCAQYGFNPNKSAILYYIKDLVSELYKVGVTNRTVEDRFSRKDKDKDFLILKTWSFNIGRDAKNREQTILEEFQEFRVNNENYRDNQGGFTEFFSKDILNLDTEDTADTINTKENNETS